MTNTFDKLEGLPKPTEYNLVSFLTITQSRDYSRIIPSMVAINDNFSRFMMGMPVGIASKNVIVSCVPVTREVYEKFNNMNHVIDYWSDDDNTGEASE